MHRGAEERRDRRRHHRRGDPGRLRRAESGAFKIVGQPFSEERYGIGLKKGDTELQTKINDAIVKMEQDGAWKAAWDKNLGPAGIAAPAPPQIDQT